jgi:hypothetical protein
VNFSTAWVGCQGYNETMAMRIRIGTAFAIGDGFDTVVLHEAAHALGPFGDPRNTPERKMGGTCLESGTSLTADDPDSILSGTYCHKKARLSELDRVGFAFTYPKGDVPLTTSLSIAFAGQLATPHNILVKNEYVARGILPNILQSPTWAISCDAQGLYFNTADSLTAGNFPQDAECSVVHAFTDPWGRHREGAVDVVLSKAKHTAVVMTVM